MLTTDRPSYPSTINRWQLTAILLLVPVIGLATALYFASTLKPRPEAVLEAAVKVEVAVWQSPQGSGSDSRLLPCVLLTNRSNELWRNLSISLNEQFFYYHFQQFEPSMTLTIPLEQFVTKGGNVHFRPATQSVHQVDVFAQIPSGERGVYSQKVKSTTADQSDQVRLP